MDYQVYSAYDRRVVFEGSKADCWRWLMAQGEVINGAIYYRTWTENGDTYYDMGTVYIFNQQQKVIDNAAAKMYNNYIR